MPSSQAGNQPDAAANVENQNIETSAEPHIAGPDAVESGDSVVSDQVLVTLAVSDAPETGGPAVSDQVPASASRLSLLLVPL